MQNFRCVDRARWYVGSNALSGQCYAVLWPQTTTQSTPKYQVTLSMYLVYQH